MKHTLTTLRFVSIRFCHFANYNLIFFAAGLLPCDRQSARNRLAVTFDWLMSAHSGFYEPPLNQRNDGGLS